MNRESLFIDEHLSHAGGMNDAFLMSFLVVYNDMRAAFLAVHTIDWLERAFLGRMSRRLMPAPISQVYEPDGYEHLLSNANSAEMIIISFNGPDDFPPAFKKWALDYATQRRADDTDTAIVALLSSNGRYDAEDSPRYQFLKNFTNAAGLDFFAPMTEMEEESCARGQMEVVG